MSILKLIIKNELDKRLGRDARSEDINNAVIYISDWIGDIKFPALSDITEALEGYVNDNYVQCDMCGEYHHPDDMIDHYGYRVCDVSECKVRAEEEFDFNPHREWGTY